MLGLAAKCHNSSNELLSFFFFFEKTIMLKMIKMIKTAQEGKYLILHSVTLLWAGSLFCVCVCFVLFAESGKKPHSYLSVTRQRL